MRPILVADVTDMTGLKVIDALLQRSVPTRALASLESAGKFMSQYGHLKVLSVNVGLLLKVLLMLICIFAVVRSSCGRLAQTRRNRATATGDGRGRLRLRLAGAGHAWLPRIHLEPKFAEIHAANGCFIQDMGP